MLAPIDPDSEFDMPTIQNEIGNSFASSSNSLGCSDSNEGIEQAHGWNITGNYCYPNINDGKFFFQK